MLDNYDKDLARASRLVDDMLNPETPRKQVERLALDPVFTYFPDLLARIHDTKIADKRDVLKTAMSRQRYKRST